MKQKVLTKIMVLCVLVLLMNVNAINAAASKSKDDLKKPKLSPAQQYYKDFQNNIFSENKIDINIKNQYCKHFFESLSGLYKFKFIYKGDKKNLFSCQLNKVHIDLLVSYIILKCNLELKLDGENIIIKDKIK